MGKSKKKDSKSNKLLPEGINDNLYIKKELLAKDNDTLPKVLENTSEDQLGLRLLNITCGEESVTVLKKIMHIYFLRCQPVIEECLEKGKLSRCSYFASDVRNFLKVCHLRRCKTEQVSTDEASPSYIDLVASLCAIYVDLLVVTKRGSESMPKTAKKLCSFCCYLTAGMPEYQLDILLQVSAVQTSDIDIIQPFVSKCFSLRPDSNNRHYLKYVLALKQFKWALSEENFQECRKVEAPKQFLKWLRQRNPSSLDNIPEDKKFKKRQITRFLLEESTKETDSLLLDTFTIQNPGVECKSSDTEMQDGAAESNTDAPTTWTLDKGLEQAKENLFFIDTKGNNKSSESENVKEKETKEIILKTDDESDDDVTFLWEEKLELEDEEEETWSDNSLDEDKNENDPEIQVMVLQQEIENVINKTPVTAKQKSTQSPKIPEKVKQKSTPSPKIPEKVKQKSTLSPKIPEIVKEQIAQNDSTGSTEVVVDLTQFSAKSSHSKDEAARIRERLFDDLMQKEQLDEDDSDQESKMATIEGAEIVSDSVDSDEENMLNESLVLPNLSPDKMNTSKLSDDSCSSPDKQDLTKIAILDFNSEEAVTLSSLSSTLETKLNQSVTKSPPLGTRSSKRNKPTTPKSLQTSRTPDKSSKKSSKRAIIDPHQTLLPSAPKAQKVESSETSVGLEDRDLLVADTPVVVQSSKKTTSNSPVIPKKRKSALTTPKSSKKNESKDKTVDVEGNENEVSHEMKSKQQNKSWTTPKNKNKENVDKGLSKTPIVQQESDSVVKKADDIRKYFLRRKRETSESSVTLDNTQTPTKSNITDMASPSKAVIKQDNSSTMQESEDEEITFKKTVALEVKPSTPKSRRKSLSAKEYSSKAKSSGKRYSLRNQHE